MTYLEHGISNKMRLGQIGYRTEEEPTHIMNCDIMKVLNMNQHFFGLFTGNNVKNLTEAFRYTQKKRNKYKKTQQIFVFGLLTPVLLTSYV